MDISQDSKLIITSSADKNIKIWGLDFGDCHKSIFAHEESIMSVGFEKGMGHDGFGSTGRGSHLFWSIGKDGLVKYWDGDKVCDLVIRYDIVPVADHDSLYLGSSTLSKRFEVIIRRFGHWR